jgi:hypothetical protein
LYQFSNFQKHEIDYNKEAQAGKVTNKTKFQYAWCLVRSRSDDDKGNGILLLDQIIKESTSKEEKVIQMKNDSLYFKALGLAKLNVSLMNESKIKILF